MTERSTSFSYRDSVNRLAVAMKGALDPGDVAQLRRLDPRAPGGSAFWRALTLYVEPHSPLQSDEARRLGEESAWAAVMRGMAHMSGLHTHGRRLGNALALADLSELRLNRLLRAEGAVAFDELAGVSTLLAARAIPVDWAELAELVLIRSDDGAERLRRRIARDFYRSLLHSPRKD
jgi:CRISPR type I-E-associated protein CasB/Cse2